MRKTSKLLALVLAVLMMLSIASVSVSAQYTDVSVDDEALNDAVNLLTTLKVAYGTTDTTFAPDENVTRQQMAAFVYRLMKAGKQVTGGDNTTAFTDLDDSTFYYMVSWASKNGIIKGTSATTFNPKGGITLQDCYVMLVRALGYEKETTLPYPIGFIDEAERIGLDENLPSTLQYTDTLTRGNVAIILANAFYAEMNEVTTKYEWVDNGKTGSEQFSAYVPVEVPETVAHKIFGVVEETFEVYATSHYGFNGVKPLYGDKNDVDRIAGVRFDEDDKALNGGSPVTIEMKDLGLAGSSDDYFLAQITLFVKKDSSDYTKDEFLAAKSNLIKKTATAKDVVLETATKNDKEYYVGGVKDKSKDKVMTGYATFAGTKAYLDADNAPYSYTDIDKKGSVEFIKMTNGSYDEDGNSTFEYAATGDDFDGLYDATGTNGSHDALSIAFETAFPRIYNKGLYELDVYDIDGDGYAEYVMEKPYQFAKVEVKKNKEYKGLTGTGYPKTFNTEDAVINGTYADKDYVLGFFPANNIPYVEIKEVVKPVESMVIAKSNGDESKTATLKSGEVIEFVDADKKLMGYNGYTIASVGAGKSYKMYIKDGVLLYSDNLSTDGFDAAANYAIVLNYDETSTTKYKTDGTTGTTTSDPRIVYDATGVSNGEFKTYLYVNAVMGGAVKAVKLADYAYTHIDYANNVYTKVTDVESLKITDKTVAETVMSEDFYNKFATYTVDGESAYTFTALDIQDATNASAVFGDKDEENSIVYYADDPLKMKHYTGSIYSIVGTKIGDMERFNVKDYTKVIIKTEDDDGDDVYTEYTAATLPKFDETTFNNVKAIFVNNKNSSIENLGILYAEINEFGSTGSKDYRIVTAITNELNSNNKEIQKVTVLDPKTATTTTAETASGYTAAVNNIVEMQEDGKVKKATIGDSYVEEKIFGIVTLKDYDEDNKFLTLVGDSRTYIVDDATTILYYTKTNTYEMTDTDVLVNGSDNSVMDLKDSDSVRLYVVAVDGDDKDNADIVKAKTIIAIDKTFNGFTK